jgi:hypothetical protein
LSSTIWFHTFSLLPMVELWPFLLDFGLIYKCIYLHMHLCVNSNKVQFPKLCILKYDLRGTTDKKCRVHVGLNHLLLTITCLQILWIHFYSWHTNFRGFRGCQQTTNLNVRRKMTIWFPFGSKQGFDNTNGCSHVGNSTLLHDVIVMHVLWI